MREARQLDRLKHRLDVLLLVLHDEAEGKAAVQERVFRVELDLLEHGKRPRANFGEIRMRGGGIEQLERGPLLPLVGERVVGVVDVGVDRLGSRQPRG